MDRIRAIYFVTNAGEGAICACFFVQSGASGPCSGNRYGNVLLGSFLRNVTLPSAFGPWLPLPDQVESMIPNFLCMASDMDRCHLFPVILPGITRAESGFDLPGAPEAHGTNEDEQRTSGVKICNIGARCVYRLVIRENPGWSEASGLQQGRGEAMNLPAQRSPRNRDTNAEVARIVLKQQYGRRTWHNTS